MNTLRFVVVAYIMPWRANNGHLCRLSILCLSKVRRKAHFSVIPYLFFGLQPAVPAFLPHPGTCGRANSPYFFGRGRRCKESCGWEQGSG